MTGSLTMVLALRAGRLGYRQLLVRLLLGTAGLGFAFLAIKGYEYARDAAAHILPAFV